MLLLALNLEFSTPFKCRHVDGGGGGGFYGLWKKMVLGHLPGKIGFDFTSLLLFIAL